MTIIIIIFGSLILLAGALLLINPQTIFGFLRKNIENPVIQLFAILVRLVIGILLITQSNLSRYPSTIEIIGWILIIAGISLALIGPANFRQLMSWVLKKFVAFGQIAGVIAIAFGGFLVYAFI